MRARYPEIQDYRTGAFVMAMEKIALSYQVVDVRKWRRTDCVSATHSTAI